LKARQEKGNDAPIPFYKRAIELDPNFAIAYAHLGQVYANSGVNHLATENSIKAFKLRDRVSERERLYIDSRYYGNVTGEKEKVIQVLEQWRQEYPREAEPANALVFEYRELGRYEDAFREARDAAQLEPSPTTLDLLAFAALTLNRLDEAEAILKDLHARDSNSFEDESNNYSLYLLAFVRNDPASMQKRAARMAGTDSENLPLLSDTEAYYGRLRKARELTRQAVGAQFGDREGATSWKVESETESAVQEVVFGYPQQAQQDITAALTLNKGPDIPTLAALTMALAGETDRAETFVAEMEKRHPLDTILSLYAAPTIRAAIELSRNNPAKAVQDLEVTSHYELGEALADYQATLFPVYLRGQAFLALHKGREAAAEFQKYIDHPGVVRNYPLGSLARLGLARAYAVQGDTPKARIAYQDFFSLWKDADSDIPILKEAKV